MAERDKKPPINEVNKVYIDDFSGGLNSTISGSLLSNNEAQTAINISFEQKGTLRPRKGTRKRYLIPFADVPVTGMGVYYKSDGTSRLLITTGEKIFYDKPHLSTKWTEKADWEQAGTEKSRLLDTSIEEGSLLIKAGNQKLIKSATFGALSGVANSTYGYEITPKQDIVVIGFKIYKTTDAKDYGIHLWKVSDKTLLVSKVEIIGVGKAEWDDIFISPITLTKDVAYRFAVSCVDANLITTITSPVFNDELVTVGASYSSNAAGKYVETADATKRGIDLIFDETVVTDKFDGVRLLEGTSTNLDAEYKKVGVEFPTSTKIYTTQSDFDLGTKNNTSTTETLDSVVLSRQV